MKLKLIRIHLRNLFLLALAAGIGFVYPVHVIVEHSGLFDHHGQYHHDDHFPGDPESEDDLCALCLTLNTMKASEGYNPDSGSGEITSDALKSGAPDNVAITERSVRAPPVPFDF